MVNAYGGYSPLTRAKWQTTASPGWLPLCNLAIGSERFCANKEGKARKNLTF